jgi:hypothetical protein
MKKNIFFLLAATASMSVLAQNPRAGQEGAGQLLLNNYAASSGLNGINIGSVDGIESSAVNPAGLAYTPKTEINANFGNLWMGTGIKTGAFGFAQAMGEEGSGGVLGLSINSINLGDITRTTTSQPDGTLGTFKPNVTNMAVSYAKKFTDRISVGASLRIVNEGTPEISASGASFDAGVQYRSENNLKLGLALRNVGSSMKYAGDGLSGRTNFNSSGQYQTSVQIPAEKFELPTMLSMGGSYDVAIGENQKIVPSFAFISNAFYFNQLGLGLEYHYKQVVILRAAYLYEKGIFGKVGIDRFNIYTGPSAGASFQIPFKTGKVDDAGEARFSKLGLDVSYRPSNPFNGTLNLGLRLSL